MKDVHQNHTILFVVAWNEAYIYVQFLPKLFYINLLTTQAYNFLVYNSNVKL